MGGCKFAAITILHGELPIPINITNTGCLPVRILRLAVT